MYYIFSNSKKGHQYSYFKQNVAHLASTSLQQQQQQQQQSETDNLRTRSLATPRGRIESDKIEYELVDKPPTTTSRAKTMSPNRLTAESSLVNTLQYGDVFIKCTSIFN